MTYDAPAGDDEIEVRRGGLVIWRGVVSPLDVDAPQVGDVLNAPPEGVRKWVVWAKSLEVTA